MRFYAGYKGGKQVTARMAFESVSQAIEMMSGMGLDRVYEFVDVYAEKHIDAYWLDGVSLDAPDTPPPPPIRLRKPS